MQTSSGLETENRDTTLALAAELFGLRCDDNVQPKWRCGAIFGITEKTNFISEAK